MGRALQRFDQDLHERLRLNLEHARGLVRRTERLFWSLTRYVLASQRVGDESPQVVYRLSHPLGRWVLDQAKRTETVPGSVAFTPADAAMKVTMAEGLAGHSGYLTVHRMVIKGAEIEEYLLVSGVDGESASLNPEAAEKLFAVPGRVIASVATLSFDRTRLDHEVERHAQAVASRSAERSGTFVPASSTQRIRSMPAATSSWTSSRLMSNRWRSTRIDSRYDGPGRARQGVLPALRSAMGDARANDEPVASRAFQTFGT